MTERLLEIQEDCGSDNHALLSDDRTAKKVKLYLPVLSGMTG